MARVLVVPWSIARMKRRFAIGSSLAYGFVRIQ
jgi:hypothetical protein